MQTTTDDQPPQTLVSYAVTDCEGATRVSYDPTALPPWDMVNEFEENNKAFKRVPDCNKTNPRVYPIELCQAAEVSEFITLNFSDTMHMAEDIDHLKSLCHFDGFILARVK